MDPANIQMPSQQSQNEISERKRQKRFEHEEQHPTKNITPIRVRNKVR
jgi:hypothetical protein